MHDGIAHMDDVIRRKALDYLANHNTLTLSTSGPEGPWAAGLFYVNDGYNLYWLSDPETRHAHDLARDPRAAVAIHEDYQDWQAIQGIQMEGVAHLVSDAAPTSPPMRLYLAKFPFLKQSVRGAAALVKAMSTARLYRFIPTRVLFIDNSRGLGRRDPIEIEPS